MEAFARSLHPNTTVTETSARTRTGVDELFQKIGRRLLNEVTAPEGLTPTVNPALTGVARPACAC